MKKVEVNKELFLELVKQRFSAKEIAKRLNMKYGTVRKRCAEWGVRVNPIRKHSEETKKKLSSAKKLWCSKNPEKHNWRKNDKFKSVPCEKLKTWLKSKDVQYVEEFMPLFKKGRYYSIDIAFPDKKIGIEINGNQHYENDGSLKLYYKQRHDAIESDGWKLYELHYSVCFNLQKIEEMIPTILKSETKAEFDYANYKPKARIKKYCKICGKETEAKRVRCNECFQPKTPTLMPSKNELELVILENGIMKASKKLDVSHSTLLRWCDKHKIERLVRGKSKKEKRYACQRCNTDIKTDSKHCVSCGGIMSRKIEWPEPEAIKKMIWDRPTTAIAKELGVSDKAVEKYCIKHNIEKPPRGHWMKIQRL